MVNIKKIDEKDMVFLNKPLSDKEEKEFSDFLKSRNKKLPMKRVANRSKNKLLS
jgi:DNA-directed RNA polymerase sigma subunit (sigma70/sigma32)